MLTTDIGAVLVETECENGEPQSQCVTLINLDLFFDLDIVAGAA